MSESVEQARRNSPTRLTCPRCYSRLVKLMGAKHCPKCGWHTSL